MGRPVPALAGGDPAVAADVAPRPAADDASGPAPPGRLLGWPLAAVHRLGWAGATAAVVAVVVAASVAITIAVNLAQGDRLADLTAGIGIAVAVPVLLATPSIGIQLRLVAHLALARRLLQEEVERRRAVEERLRALAERDALTGLANRAHFLEAGERFASLARRHGRPVALLAVDLDGFKRVNDTGGHAAGDAALRAVAAAIAGGLRRSDLPGRLGGDEFAVLLPDTDAAAAAAAAERARAAAAAAGVTVSVGVAAAAGDGARLDELLARADRALYAAKRAGRDRVVTLHGPDAPTA